jgi:hypothetical protein
MKKLLAVVPLFLFVFATKLSFAGFALTVDPADLNFNGPGNYNVDFQIAYVPSGLNTLSGYTIRFGSPANASLGVLPAGVSVNSASEVLPVSSGGALFNYNNLANSLAASNLGIPGNTAISATPTTLFTLNFALGNDASYNVGVDLDNAQRGGLFAEQIATEFFNPNNLTDLSFTLNNLSAVPEPTSILTAASLGLGGMFYRRKRRKVANVKG